MILLLLIESVNFCKSKGFWPKLDGQCFCPPPRKTHAGSPVSVIINDGFVVARLHGAKRYDSVLMKNARFDFCPVTDLPSANPTILFSKKRQHGRCPRRLLV